MRRFWLVPAFLLMMGCGFDMSLAEWESSSAEESSSGAILPINLGSAGATVATEMAKLQSDRDIALERLRTQQLELEDVEEQIEVVGAQIDIIPAFRFQERRLTTALNADTITSGQAEAAFRLASIGIDALNAMVEAQQERDDDAEKIERGVLVSVVEKLTAELDRLGV
jgi:hypothetical protein